MGAGHWDFDNDGTVDSTEQNPSYTYANPGTYTVSLTVSNSGGSDTETKVEYITVYGVPEADFSASLTQAVVGQTIEFTHSSTGHITSWSWDFNNDGTVDSTEQSPSYTYETAAEYTVSLTVTGPGGSDNEVKTEYITVEEEDEQDTADGEGDEQDGKWRIRRLRLTRLHMDVTQETAEA